MLLNPAVRGLTPANMPPTRLSRQPSGPRVAGFDHSRAVIAATPTSSSSAEPHTVSRVWIDQDRGLRHSRYSSSTTGKPRPPRMTATATVPQIHGSPTKRVKLSEYNVVPALLKALTAWNVPCHSAVPADSP